MEINLRQRVIGGVVLVALAVIFLPLLFKGSAIKSKHVAIETSIPTAPAKPTMQTTITMQGEELNPPKAVAATENNVPDQRLAPQEQPIATALEQSVKAVPSKPKVVAADVVSNNTSSTPSKKTIKAEAVKDVALEESIAEVAPPVKPAKTQANKIYAKVQAQTASKAKAASHHATTKSLLKSLKTADVSAAKAAKSAKSKIQPAKAWVVQLGSFGDAAKAKTLEKQLRAKGFTAYSRSVKTPIGSMTRVYVGPEVKREKAATMLAKLDGDMHLKGVVVAFDPTQVK